MNIQFHQVSEHLWFVLSQGIIIGGLTLGNDSTYNFNLAVGQLWMFSAEDLDCIAGKIRELNAEAQKPKESKECPINP